MKSCMCAATLILASASSASASFVNPVSWITDIRRCSASYSGNGSGSSWQDRPVAFGEYTDGGADIIVANGVETWSSHCSQQSSMDGSSASFEAHSEATIIAGLMSNPLLSQAQAKLDLWFTVADPTEYHIEGEVSETGHSDSMGVVRLIDLDGNAIENIVSGANSTRTFEVSGILQPGTYHLYAESLGKCRTVPMMVVSEGTASCRMAFTATVAPDSPPPAPRPRTSSSTDSPPPRR